MASVGIVLFIFLVGGGTGVVCLGGVGVVLLVGTRQTYVFGLGSELIMYVDAM